MNKKLLVLALCAILVSGCTTPPVAPAPTASAPATAGALTPVNVCYSAPAATQAVPWYALENGIFEKYGLNADQIQTYDDLVQAGKNVKDATNGEVKMLAMDSGSKLCLGDPHLIIDLLLVQNGLGGTYFSREDDKVVVDTPEGIVVLHPHRQPIVPFALIRHRRSLYADHT